MNNQIKGILTATLLLFSLLATAQISAVQKQVSKTLVGKISPMGSFIAELYYTVHGEEKADTVYTFMFRDATYRHITSIANINFYSEDNTLEKLYEALQSVFLPENKNNKDYALSFVLGKKMIQISNYKIMGASTAMFIIEGGAYILLSKNQIDKLFGKMERAEYTKNINSKNE